MTEKFIYRSKKSRYFGHKFKSEDAVASFSQMFVKPSSPVDKHVTLRVHFADRMIVARVEQQPENKTNN